MKAFKSTFPSSQTIFPFLLYTLHYCVSSVKCNTSYRPHVSRVFGNHWYSKSSRCRPVHTAATWTTSTYQDVYESCMSKQCIEDYRKSSLTTSSWWKRSRDQSASDPRNNRNLTRDSILILLPVIMNHCPSSIVFQWFTSKKFKITESTWEKVRMIVVHRAIGTRDYWESHEQRYWNPYTWSIS